ncbi:MAG: hypothetical protein ACP5GU_09400 [Thermoprotei archaeon]
MTEYVYLGMNNFQMQDIRKLQNMVSELIKRTMDELNITRIRKNFLMCYYGLSSKEAHTIIKLLKGSKVPALEVVSILVKILYEDVLNSMLQRYSEATLIIYSNDYKINMNRHVTRNCTNYSKYKDRGIRNNIREIKTPSPRGKD